MKICMVLVDCLRPDHLGCYGYKKNTSPNIDAIASGGMVFKNVVSQCNWTYPSVYSMFTGRYPSTLQIAWFDQRVSGAFPVLPEILAKKGFKTGIFSNLKILLNREGFSSHFQESRHVLLQDNVPKLIKEWLGGAEDSFLLFHTAEYIHEPYFADKELVEKFLDDDTRKEADTESKIVQTLTSRNASGNSIREVMGAINQRVSKPAPADVKYLLSCYDAGICHVDKIMGEIYDVVKQCGDEYLFILAADHGQAFMEHRVMGHGFHLYDELVKVPFILDFNGKMKGKVDRTAQLMDLFPTVLDLLGIERDFPIDARSMLTEAGGEGFAVSEGYPFITIRDNRHKLITTYNKFERYEETVKCVLDHHVMNSWKRNMLARFLSFFGDKFFDIVNDPLEKVNVRKSEPDAYKKLRAGLEAMLEKSRKDALQSKDVGFDAEMRRQLEGLGYL